MRLYTPEECQQWIKYQASRAYGSSQKVLVFSPQFEGDKYPILTEQVLDLDRKYFHHNIERLQAGITLLAEKAPEFLSKILGNMTIFLCPNPDTDVANAVYYDRAEFNSDLIIWGRTTAIPFAMTDYIIAHELGHAVQHKYAKDNHCYRKGCDCMKNWRMYLELRGAPKGDYEAYVDWDKKTDEGVYETVHDFLCLSEKSEHHPRHWDEQPREWFAEDFRYLYGLDTTQTWGLPIPEPDNAVRGYFEALRKEAIL
jgi:hypothetical protein